MRAPTDISIDAPAIVQLAAQQTAVIRLTVARGAIREVMQPAVAELMAVLAAQGIAPAGPRFSHHLRMDPEVFDLEIGIPVTVPVLAAGRVQPGMLPATQVARTVYRGSYEGLGNAWGEFKHWIAASGHVAATDLWENYLEGPPALADAAQWRTELNQPLVQAVTGTDPATLA